LLIDLNPGSNDWKEEIKQFQVDNKTRIDVDEFASIYEQEAGKKKATTKDIMEALKAVDPQNGEIGMCNSLSSKNISTDCRLSSLMLDCSLLELFVILSHHIGLVRGAALNRYLMNIGDTMTGEQVDTIMSEVMDKDKNVVIADLLKLIMSDG